MAKTVLNNTLSIIPNKGYDGAGVIVATFKLPLLAEGTFYFTSDLKGKEFDAEYKAGTYTSGKLGTHLDFGSFALSGKLGKAKLFLTMWGFDGSKSMNGLSDIHQKVGKDKAIFMFSCKWTYEKMQSKRKAPSPLATRPKEEEVYISFSE